MKRAITSHIRDFAAIIGMVALAVGIGGYILANQRLRFPLIEEKPYQVWVEAQNARGVTPGQGQTVRVAGTRVGDVGEVKLEEGKALIRMDLDPEYDDLVRAGRHGAPAPAHRPEGHVPRARPGQPDARRRSRRARRSARPTPSRT